MNESPSTKSNTPEWDKMWETYQRCKDKEGDLEGPKDFGRRMERERNEAREWCAKLQRTTQTLTCVYCGKEYPPGTPTHGAEVLTEHIKVCEKHPMNSLQKAFKMSCQEWAEDHTYLQNLAKKIGVSPTKVEGDSYSVPGIQELADMIVEYLTRK